METWIQMIITVVCSVLASSGFWAFVMKRDEKDDAERQMLKGLGHDKVMFLGMKYIERGYITKDEYENLHDYLYVPYEKLNGNGSAKRIMLEVEKLPIHSEDYKNENQ